MLNFTHIPDLSGWSAPGDGTVLGESVRLDFVDGTSRQATNVELLTAAILAKRKEINAERNRREQGGFTYLGKPIDSDPVSCQRISVAGATAQLALANGVTDYELTWTCKDNTTLTLDAVGVLGMVQALGLHGVHVHTYGSSLKAAVEACQTVAEVDAVDILSGWPE